MTENHIMGAAGDEKIVACQDRRIMDQGTDIRVNTRLKGQAGLPPPPDDAMMALLQDTHETGRHLTGSTRRRGTAQTVNGIIPLRTYPVWYCRKPFPRRGQTTLND